MSLAVFAVLLSVSSALAADAPNLAALGSFEVPTQGEHAILDAAFLSPEGHLVLQMDNLDNGLRVNYYDTQTGGWLLPAAVTDKNEVIIAQRQLVADGYTALPHLPAVNLANDTKAYNVIHLKDICFRPYADFFTVAPSGKSPIARAIYIRRNTPATIASANDPKTPSGPAITTHTCKTASGADPALTTGYKQESAFFMPDNGGGFFALVGRYAIHFDANGNTDFFRGRDNPVFLSAEDTDSLQDILIKADKSAAPQDAIDQAEALIGTAAQAQMQNTPSHPGAP